MPQLYGLRYARLCVFAAAAPLLFGSSVTEAGAKTKHAIVNGETVSAIARRFHVTLGAIARANDLSISQLDSLPDGRRLVIPSSPHKTVIDATMHRRAIVRGDGVAVRLGPDASRPRLTIADAGTPVVVTAKRDGWAQIALSDGRIGWVRQDFVRYGKKPGKSEGQAIANGQSQHKRTHKSSAIVGIDEDRLRRRHRLSRQAVGASVRISKIHHQHQTPVRESRVVKRHRHAEQYISSIRSHRASRLNKRIALQATGAAMGVSRAR